MSANTNADVAAMEDAALDLVVRSRLDLATEVIKLRLENQSQQAEITRLSAMVERVEAVTERRSEWSGDYNKALDKVRQAITTEQGESALIERLSSTGGQGK